MPEPSSFHDYGPITWFHRKPIYLTTILVALLVFGMFATIFLATAHASLQVLAFSAAQFWEHLALWQIVSYPLLDWPGFFFIFGLFCFYWFGTDVERYLGRSRYITLLVLLIITPPLLQSVWWKAAGAYGICMGSNDLTIGFFIAFATLYPNLEFWGWISMKWLAFAGIVLSSMNYLPEHDWPGLSTLLATCAVAFGYIRFLQRGGSFELPVSVKRFFGRAPNLRVVPKAPVGGADISESIDPLLDKISKHGISSLTARERKQLQRARETLLKKQD
jgi:membrane associated rhomboid family serine protease